MSHKRWAVISIVAVSALLIIHIFTVGHRTPKGQPQLLQISSQTLPQFSRAFNHFGNAERVVLLMSPTCPVCLRGSSAVDAILQHHPGTRIHVFAVWEPMLPTDWSRPDTQVLARLSDPRVTQVWDKDHLIAGLVRKGADGRRPACCTMNGNWWDVLAVYPPESRWKTAAPKPELLNGTIVSTAPKWKAQFERLSQYKAEPTLRRVANAGQRLRPGDAI